jgi:hypothetical protein
MIVSGACPYGRYPQERTKKLQPIFGSLPVVRQEKNNSFFSFAQHYPSLLNYTIGHSIYITFLRMLGESNIIPSIPDSPD